uniref:Putative LOC100889629 [Strongylocentrotus purpuratus] n=1 Tax=Lepeophtheirus salmonis TaxID=72036 RepID=A0A0K2U778_LEPSM
MKRGGHMESFIEQIDELEENEFIQEVKLKDNEEGFYLNIRGVLKTTSESTTLRIVCNSTKEVWAGFTYNDCIEKGPDLTNRVFEVLIRFRTDRVAFHGDISKMFHRIFVKDDSKYQSIVWRNGDERANLKTYEWTRLIFGDKPSPDLSQSTLRFIAEKYANEYPEARRVVFEDIYVDEIATSVESGEVGGIVK